jgi:hypothetical protein
VAFWQLESLHRNRNKEKSESLGQNKNVNEKNANSRVQGTKNATGITSRGPSDEGVEPIDVPGLVAVPRRGGGRLDPSIRPAAVAAAPLSAAYRITFLELDGGSGDSDGCDGEERCEEVFGGQHGC